MIIENGNDIIEFQDIFDNAPRGDLYDIKYNENYKHIVTQFRATIDENTIDDNYTTYLIYENGKALIEKVTFSDDLEIDHVEETDININDIRNYIGWVK